MRGRDGSRRFRSRSRDRHRSCPRAHVGRRHSRSRFGSHCDDREARRCRQHEDDEEEDRHESHHELSRCDSSRAHRAGDRTREENQCCDHRSGRSSDHSSGGYGVSRRSVPVLPSSIAVDCMKMKASITTSPPPVACWEWSVAIMETLRAISLGFSRLASPPPCSIVELPLPSSWEEEDVPGAAWWLPPSPLRPHHRLRSRCRGRCLQTGIKLLKMMWLATAFWLAPLRRGRKLEETKLTVALLFHR